MESLAKKGGRLSRRQLEEVLTEMSSGSRLWYRAGALTAWRLERREGRDALVKSVKRPEDFANALRAEVGRLGS